MIYVVSYDLTPRPVMRVTKPKDNRIQLFYQELEDSRSWWHYLEKTWLISTDETLKELDSRLRRHLEPTDKLLVVIFHGEYAGTLPNEAWEWIEERMSAGELAK